MKFKRKASEICSKSKEKLGEKSAKFHFGKYPKKTSPYLLPGTA